jgi:hypothetical protein
MRLATTLRRHKCTLWIGFFDGFAREIAFVGAKSHLHFKKSFHHNNHKITNHQRVSGPQAKNTGFHGPLLIIVVTTGMYQSQSSQIVVALTRNKRETKRHPFNSSYNTLVSRRQIPKVNSSVVAGRTRSHLRGRFWYGGRSCDNVRFGTIGASFCGSEGTDV